jgi:hypothetical protein
MRLYGLDQTLASMTAAFSGMVTTVIVAILAHEAFLWFGLTS